MKTRSFFALLRLGLQTCAVEDADVAEFTQLTAKDWTDIKAMADKQSVAAIVFDGLDSLVNRYGRDRIAPGIDMAWWQQFVYEWIGTTTQIEQKNKVQREVMDDLASQWRKNYLRVMIMKGQASGTMYPRPEHRSPGDIDCYLFNEGRRTKDEGIAQNGGYRIGNEVAREMGADVDESWYKHSQIRYRGEMFENHQYFVHTRDGKRGKRLEKELENVLAESAENAERKGHTEPTTNREQSSLLELPRCEGGRRSHSKESTEAHRTTNFCDFCDFCVTLKS